jgi:thiamine biosynthesis lipoprotein
MMGMTITVEVVDEQVQDSDLAKIFDYFDSINNQFSVFKKESEISKINRGEIAEKDYSSEMREVFVLSERTKKETNGYFDIVNREGKINPSGLVKGWAIYKAAQILWIEGFKNFFVDAGGDIQTSGVNVKGEPWSVGIRNPFNPETEIIKVLSLSDKGVATSGTYSRGQHVYNPHDKKAELNDILSITVIGPNVYEADRFATAALAMGREGINFIEGLEGFEGYAVDHKGIAIMTSGFNNFVKKDA